MGPLLHWTVENSCGETRVVSARNERQALGMRPWGGASIVPVAAYMTDEQVLAAQEVVMGQVRDLVAGARLAALLPHQICDAVRTEFDSTRRTG